MTQVRIYRVEHKVSGQGPFIDHNDRYLFNRPDHDRPQDACDWPSLRAVVLDVPEDVYNTHRFTAAYLGADRNTILYGFLSLKQAERYFPNLSVNHHPDYHIVIWLAEPGTVVSDEWQCAFDRTRATKLDEVISFGELA